MKRYFLSLAIVLLCSVAISVGQDHTPTKVTNQNRTGPLPFSSSIGTDIESVDIPTGKLRVNISIASAPGRGMDSSFYLRYDSLFWVSPAYVGPQQELVYEWKIESNGGLFPDHGIGWNINKARITNGSMQFPCNEIGQAHTASYVTNYIYHDPDGGKHPLAVKGAVVTPYCAVQDWNGPDLGGDGIWAKKLSAAATPEIYLADGTRFVQNQDWRDPNGNTKSADPTGLDTLGRNIVTTTSNASQVFYHVKDSDGQQRTFTLNFGSTPLYTSFNIPSPSGNGNIQEFGNPIPVNRRVLTSVVLPNGQSYQFQYESGSYGGITRIDLPTGAFITYTWTTIVDGSKTHRAVASRTVNVGGQSHTWTFEPGLASSKVTDPVGKQSVFTHMDGVVTNVKNYDGAATGNPMREYLVDHVWDADPWDGIMPPSETLEPYEPQKVAIRPIRITTKFPEANLINKKEFDYETFTYPYHPNMTYSTYSQLVNFTTSRGNVSEIREYDWGIGAPGALLRRITKAYLHNANGAYTAKNIVSKVLTETIFDGAGAQKAQTQLEYDSTAVISTSSAPQHDYTNFGSGFTTRGNATKVKRWLNTTGGLLTTTYNYDDLGNIRSISDPLGHETSYSYTDDFSDAINRNAQAYLTQITFPQTNGINHIEKRRYFFPTGLVQRATDQNNQHTTFVYDLMNRLLQKDFPDGGQTLFAYSDTPNQVVVREDTLLKSSGTGDPGTCLGDKWASSWVQVDGLGRTIRSAKCNGAPSPNITDQVDTCYDLMGRKKFVSYPYQGPGFTPESYICTNGATRKGDTFSYDALSRPLLVTNTDGGVIDTSYFASHQVTVIDQAGKKRKSETDALGRLIKVWEPDAGGSFIYETAYQYDVLNNLLRVDQKGNDGSSANWRTRTFEYDSLSRLTRAVNPESGTIDFGYDNDGNLSSKVTPAPNQTGSATVTTNFGYDQLHRLLWKVYSDSPMAVYFEYDQAPGWSPPLTNTVGRQVAALNRLTTNGPAVAVVTSYDVMGRTLFQKHWNDRASSAPPQQFEYTYNLDGSLKTLKYPSLRQLDYSYNRGQRAVSMVDTANSINYATDASYTAWGSILGMKNGVTGSFAGITTSNQFNTRMQPVFLSAAAPGGTVMSFGYDFHLGAGNNGNVFQITNNLNNDRTQIFTYDELNRISTAHSQALIGQHCWGQSFGYDIWANLTSRTITKCSAEGAVPAATAKNQMAGHTYDAAGNYWPTGYTYDAENRLISAPGSMQFDYDSNGRRVKKSNGASGTLYWYGLAGEVLQETDLAGVLKNEYAFFNGRRIARRSSSGSVFYYFSDQLGTSRVITEANGAVCYDADFFPFGGEQGTFTNSCPQDYKFTGKERDSETNLDYFGARYYSFNFGRFTSPDPKLGSAHLINPQSRNRYTYTLNNPLKFVDPDGMDVVLAAGLSQKDRAFVVNNLARMRATPAGSAMLEKADKSKFTITVGTGRLGRTDLTKAPPGTTVFGGQTKVEGGNTRFGTADVDGHKMLVAKSPDSPTAPPIQVIIDKDQSAEIGKDPAKVFAHEIGGHTADVINAAESNPNQFIDGVNPKDETSSEAAEKALGKVPDNPSPADVKAVEQMLEPKSEEQPK